jgi:hypothetical protein
MKYLKQLTLVGVLGLGLAATSFAQDTKPTPGNTPDRPAPTKPDVRPDLPADVKALVDQLNAARDAFLAEQKALAATAKTAASKEDRAAIRAELKADARAFADTTKVLRGQLRDRIKELAKDRSDRKKPLDAAGSVGRPGTK